MTILRAAAAGGVVAALSLNAAAGAGAAVTGRGGSAVRGLDISAYQHAGSAIDWELLPGQGIHFVAVKAAEGTYYVNPYYRSDTRAAAAAGLAVMSYVFANPIRAGGAATASFAVHTVGNKRGRLPLVVDLENDPYNRHADCYGLHPPAIIAWISAFTARVQALTRQYPVIYTTAAWWRECTGSTSRFRRDPLWLAAFDGTAPTVPSAWRDWTFWQYNNQGTLAGVGQADLDYYQPTSDLPTLRPSGRPEPAKKPAAKKPAAKKPAAKKPAAKKPAAKKGGAQAQPPRRKPRQLRRSDPVPAKVKTQPRPGKSAHHRS